jgi:D-alanine--poly(phosphoribitol) ligase subunit 1
MAFTSNLGLAFRDIARVSQGSIALVYPGSRARVTYRELSMLAEAAALRLHRRGYGMGDVIAIFHDKSKEAFAAMLGCLRLGITYTNLDPDSPWERLHKILVNCQPKAVLNGFPSLAHAESIKREGSSDVILLADLFQKSDLSAVTLPAAEDVHGSTPAYIMFTSGSTGQPKGAVISHANILLFIKWARNRFEVTPKDILSSVNPIFFDNSVFDFYVAIFSGAALVPLTPAETKDPRLTVLALGDAGCTVWFSVPSLLVYLLTTRALTSASLPRVRKIIFGGEGFPKAKLKQLYDMFSEHAELENVYGPTECTCICSAHMVEAADFADMQNLATLGYLSQNFAGEILPLDGHDPDFGELLLLGPQVGLGYYNDPERTSQSFIQNPRHNLYRDIGYRTGDLVRRDAHGRFHFKGRADFQIKHMGYRIELEEIEAALGTVGGVKECAAIYVRLAEGLGRIVGFVAVEGTVDALTLIEEIARILPPYMVPKSISVLPNLPKNANGKIDRQALHQMQSL